MNLRNEPINGKLSTIRDIISTKNFVIYFEKRLMNGITPTLSRRREAILTKFLQRANALPELAGPSTWTGRPLHIQPNPTAVVNSDGQTKSPNQNSLDRNSGKPPQRHHDSKHTHHSWRKQLNHPVLTPKPRHKRKTQRRQINHSTYSHKKHNKSTW